jgi:Fe-S oxidoreductase
MANNRESSLCCGGGGGGAWNDDLAQQGFGVLRVRQALNTGAEVIATACPYCIRMLNDGVRELGVKNQIVVRDLAELLLQSVVVRDERIIKERVDLGFDQEVRHV